LDLEVTFHPGQDKTAANDPDINYKKIPCYIKGGEILNLSLMGKSVEQDTSSNE
jgi:hypothetical protein